MPLTISHPVAIVPLWYLSKKRLDLPALTVGAMIPDISYFLYLRPVGNIGHSMWGVLVQGIPASLVLLLLYSNVMLGSLRSLSPSTFGKLLPATYSLGGLNKLLIVLFSITLGAMTHILWDSFTHKGAYFVELWPILETRAFGLPVYKFLQYGSGVFGLLTISLLMNGSLGNARKYEGPTLSPIASKVAWTVIFFTIISITAMVLLTVSSSSGYLLIVQSAVGIIAGIWMGFFIYSVAFKLGWFAANIGQT